MHNEDKALIDWLIENGAIIDKVKWPATSSIDGIRGAVATTDIHPMDPMFEIPSKLMMGPPQALLSKEVTCLMEVKGCGDWKGRGRGLFRHKTPHITVVVVYMWSDW
jgi:hypothetical protein